MRFSTAILIAAVVAAFGFTTAQASTRPPAHYIDHRVVYVRTLRTLDPSRHTIGLYWGRPFIDNLVGRWHTPCALRGPYVERVSVTYVTVGGTPPTHYRQANVTIRLCGRNVHRHWIF